MSDREEYNKSSPRKAKAMTSGKNGSGRHVDLFFSILFFGLLALPLAFFSREPDFLEGRKADSFPSIRPSVESIKSFPAGFEAFFADRLGFRGHFVSLKSAITVNLLGTSPDDRVLLGKDGWMFMNAWPLSPADGAVQQYRGVRLLSEAELDAWATGLERRREGLAGRGARYLFVIVPLKHSIYPEFLPKRINKVRDLNPADQLVDVISRRTHVDFLDLRKPLLAAKAEGQLYWRTDTHWTDLGAYIAYREIARTLSGWWPQVDPLPRSLLLPKVAESYGDLVRALRLDGVDRDFFEVNLALAPVWPAVYLEPAKAINLPQLDAAGRLRFAEMPGGEVPQAIVLHDSFGYGVMPFLSSHFERALYVRRPETRRFLEEGERTQPFLDLLVEKSPPDVVIDMVVERNLVWAYRDYP